MASAWAICAFAAEACAFAEALAAADGVRDDRIQRFVIPPFTVVREVKAILSDTSVKVGAQNMHWAADGAWTGEISPTMLKDCEGSEKGIIFPVKK